MKRKENGIQEVVGKSSFPNEDSFLNYKTMPAGRIEGIGNFRKNFFFFYFYNAAALLGR